MAMFYRPQAPLPYAEVIAFVHLHLAVAAVSWKAPRSNACLVELSAQFEAFSALMGAKLLPAPRDLLLQVYLDLMQMTSA